MPSCPDCTNPDGSPRLTNLHGRCPRCHGTGEIPLTSKKLTRYTPHLNGTAFMGMLKQNETHPEMFGPDYDWTQGPYVLASEADAAIERLKRGNEILRDELVKIDALHDSVESERDRLRAALEKIANGGICGSHETHFECPQSEDVCAIARAALSGDPGSAVETSGDAADAARYRWLKAEDRKRMPLATISWRQRSNSLPCKLADNDPLDALIDAAITSPDASVEQVYRTAVKASGDSNEAP